MTLNTLNAISEYTWQKLNQKIIYFGHQSVGNNLIEEINNILREHPSYTLSVQEIEVSQSLTEPGLYHSQIGKNMYPISKINDFADIIFKGAGDKCHIAFFKFCYVDIKESTHVKELFSTYTSQIERIESSFPNLKVLHFTVPLRTVQRGIKVPIKKIIGRPAGGYADNIKRYEFNELMREKYSKQDVLFDLAKSESMLPNGKQSTFSQNDKHYEALAPQYTDDGGHLNHTGRLWIAEQFLCFLASLST